MTEQLRYGISIVNGAHSSEILRCLSSNSFRYIEISGLNLENERLLKEISSLKLTIANVRNFMERSLCSGVSDQSQNIKNEFITCYFSRLNKVWQSSLNLRGVSADFDLETSFESPLFEKDKVEMIKRLAVLGLDSQVKFFIPVRIPYPKLLPENYNSFVRKTMLPNVSILLDIHPHEFQKMDEIADKLKSFRFTTGLVNITYEAYAGNLLSEKLLDFLFRILKKNLYEGVILFCPAINDNEAFCNEIIRLNKCLSAIES